MVTGLETQAHLDILNSPAVKSCLNTLPYISTPDLLAFFSLNLRSGTTPIKHTRFALGSKLQSNSGGGGKGRWGRLRGMAQHLSCCKETHNKSIHPSISKNVMTLHCASYGDVFLLLNGCTAPESMTGFISLDSCLEETAGNLNFSRRAAICSGPARSRKAESDQHSNRSLSCCVYTGYFRALSFCAGSEGFKLW